MEATTKINMARKRASHLHAVDRMVRWLGIRLAIVCSI